jgi:hypothetical protein
MDLVLEDRSRVGAVYFMMSEDNLRKRIKLPWLAFGSDVASMAPELPFTSRRRTRARTATSRGCSESTPATNRSSRWKRPCGS